MNHRPPVYGPQTQLVHPTLATLAATPAPLVMAAPPTPIPRDEPALGGGALAIIEGLLRSPGSVMRATREGSGTLFRLAALVVCSMILTGLVMAAFSGGLQLLWVPIKLSLGIFFCALICLPSLYIFSSLAGAEQSLKETWGALLMGVALIGVLLVGFAPVSWVFSQATSSTSFMGGMHLVFLLISSYFGLGLIKRALAAANGRPLKGTALWSLLFLLVVLQMTTTLRPLVGEYDGEIFHQKTFFLAHWLDNLS